ncbi:hypothetical protein [Paenibacillus koleovorans]|uniref:hypothetical protein n=1 Tax=Paenibacillus koleovorans TaxID=121608 RepID=UPI000FD955AA|nr:hypothetical protein [Paenibacillus koleovorans]
MTVLAGIIILIALAAGVATVQVGLSRPNREGNPGYVTRTKGNMLRLTSFYVVAAILGLAILFYVVLD